MTKQVDLSETDSSTRKRIFSERIQSLYRDYSKRVRKTSGYISAQHYENETFVKVDPIALDLCFRTKNDTQNFFLEMKTTDAATFQMFAILLKSGPSMKVRISISHKL
jgi:hypothetical protein